MAKMDVQNHIAPMMKFVYMRGIIALKEDVSNFAIDSSWGFILDYGTIAVRRIK